SRSCRAATSTRARSRRSSRGARRSVRLKSVVVLRIAQGAIAGVAAGIVTGIAARVAMRLVAIGAADGIGQLPQFTIEGTVAIILSAAIAGLPFGAVYALIERRLPRPDRAHGIWFAA